MDALRKKHADLTRQINELRDKRRQIDRRIRREEFIEKHGINQSTYYRRKRKLQK